VILVLGKDVRVMFIVWILLVSLAWIGQWYMSVMNSETISDVGMSNVVFENSKLGVSWADVLIN
jgi:hypothetical protein